MGKYMFIDVNAETAADDINSFFPGWNGKEERICVFSPHDDDALIGAGYAITAALENEAEVFIFIFSRGNFGYKDVSLKDKIETVRETESYHAYTKLGIGCSNIVRFNYSDNEMIQNMGWNPGNKFRELITALRKYKITRILVPNHYREHTDHLAVNIIGSYGAAQSGDLILVDWGEPQVIRSVVEYSVWSDLSPEDALISGRNLDMRANRIITVTCDIEEKIRCSILEYKSQLDIIKDLIESRNKRRTKNGEYIEVYLLFDPRPKLNYQPYIKLLEKIHLNNKG